ncbi:MAG TPA: acyl-CoA thioesterase [Rhabdochlamydiaceae bacterium]
MQRLKPKKVSESAVNEHIYKVFPNDLNAYGTVFGGLVMAILDRVALVVAERHSGRTCVTVSVDSMHFLAPAKRGDILIFKAAINNVWRTSMEIGVKVITEHLQTQEEVHILSAYFTFVAVDELGLPVTIPPILPVTALEKRRFKEAEMRRQHRKDKKQQRSEQRSKMKKI